VKGVLDALGWKQPHLIGHSMGAAVGTLVAGTYPELLNKLVLIEGIGPLTESVQGTPARLRASIEAETKFAAKTAQGGGKRLYPSIAAAIENRIDVVKTYPGKQSLSYEASYAIVGRSIAFATSTLTTGSPENPSFAQTLSQELIDMSNLNAGPVFFRSDPKLMIPPNVSLTEEQVFRYRLSLSSCLPECSAKYRLSHLLKKSKFLLLR
jgi:pimeloyl-ACP methyl ester carboxylesterase